MVVLLALLVVACAAHADVPVWDTSTLTAIGTADSLQVTPHCTQITGGYAYSYDLTNLGSRGSVYGFTLVFSADVPVSELTYIVAPSNWTFVVRTTNGDNKIGWSLGPSATSVDRIAVGQTKTFGFTSVYGPSPVQNVNVSSQGTYYGFSGNTYGPAAPEPGTLAALFAGIAGIGLPMIRRRK